MKDYIIIPLYEGVYHEPMMMMPSTDSLLTANHLGDDLRRPRLSGTRFGTSIGKSLINESEPCLNFKDQRDYAQMIAEYHNVGVHLTATDTRKRHTFPRQCMPPKYPLRELRRPPQTSPRTTAPCNRLAEIQ